ncbi:hypothetical protein, partial [Immundisolibacter sp.]|uniref:hypothetical protein n=1 Tax=Immundisolibacter sp. TaxID=1934948 RepID=UPI0035665981
ALAWHRLGRGGAAAWLAAVTVFFGVFVLAFHIAGGFELAVGSPVVSLSLVTASATAMFFLAVGVARLMPLGLSDSLVVTAGPPTAPWRMVPLATVAAVVGAFALLALLLAGSWPQGYEARAYHVPLAVRVLYQGTLRIVDGTWMHAYPVNMSIWAGFWIYLLPERLIALANLPFLILCVVAMFALARATGADRSAAALVAAGLATIPLFSFGALQVSADLGGVAFITIATWFVMAQRVGTHASAALAGLAAGLAFGFKSLHLVPLGLLGVWLLVGPAADGALRRRLSAACVYALAALVPMAYWLLRNYLERGNPLYPVFVPGVFDLLGWAPPPDQQLLANTANEREWVGASWRWLLYPWQEAHVAGQNFKHSSGLGPFFAATVPVAVLVGPFAAWSRRRVDLRQVQAGLLALALGVMAIWWLLGDRQPRYIMAAIPPLLALAAWQQSQTSGRWRTGYECLLASGILLMVLPPLLGQARATLSGLSNAQLSARHKQLEYPSALDHLPAGSWVVIGYERSVNLPLAGASLNNRVMDVIEAKRQFGLRGGGWRFEADAVSNAAVTYFYVRQGEKIETDGCVSLREVDALRANPFNGEPYAHGRVLYA